MPFIDLREYKAYVMAFVAFVYIHSLQYFNYVNLNPTIHGRISLALALLTILLCLFSKGPKTIPGRYWMYGILFVPILSFLPCWLENGQSPVDSARAYLPAFVALSYFLLHKAKVKEIDIVNLITALAVVRTLITIVQQFTFPDYLFCYRPEGLDAGGYFKGIEIRSGLYRFAIEDTYLSMFLVFYYFRCLLKQVNALNLGLFLFGLAGVYIDQTRQLMLSTFLAVVLVLLFSVHFKQKWIIIGVIGAVSAIVYLNADVLFEDLMDLTRSDLNSRNIRLLAYTTFLFEFWGGPLSVIFGNGPVQWASAYGAQIAYYQENLRLFRSDVGLVGAANMYGVVIVLFLIAYLVFYVFRNWKKLRIHNKMYFVAMVINLPMICIFTQHYHWLMFLGFMMYFCDNDIRHYNRRLSGRQSFK